MFWPRALVAVRVHCRLFPCALACACLGRQRQSGIEAKKDWIKKRCSWTFSPTPRRPPPTHTHYPSHFLDAFPTRNYCRNAITTKSGCATVACAASRTVALITFEECSHPLNLVAPFFATAAVAASSIRFVACDHGENSTNLSHRCQHRSSAPSLFGCSFGLNMQRWHGR